MTVSNNDTAVFTVLNSCNAHFHNGAARCIIYFEQRGGPYA